MSKLSSARLSFENFSSNSSLIRSVLILVGIEQNPLDTTQLQSCCLHSIFLVPRDFFALPHILFLEEWPIFASIVASSFLKRNLNRPRPVVSFCTVLCKQIHVLEITKGLRISYKCLKWMNIMETFNIGQTIVDYICLMAGKL